MTFHTVTEAAHLAALKTLGELVAFCNRRDGNCWRSIPHIGPGRARAIVSWLREQQASLQLTIEADLNSEKRDGIPLIAAEFVEVAPAATVTGSGPGCGPRSSESASRLTFAPLERLAVPHTLSDAQGESRAMSFDASRFSSNGAVLARSKATNNIRAKSPDITRRLSFPTLRIMRADAHDGLR